MRLPLPLKLLPLGAGFVLTSLVGLGQARADVPLPAHAPAGAGQAALSVFVGSGGDLLAASCAATPCTAAPVSLGVPAELRGKPARAEVVAIGEGRHAVVVSVADGAQSFQAVVAAPLASGAPRVLFSGLVGLVRGEDGVRTGPMVQISEPEDGVRHVLVGEQWEAVALCGRPTIIAPTLLNPKTLQLSPAKVQRLSVAERAGARRVTARRLPDDADTGASGVLSALGASSAIGAPQALTDGDPETTWSEARGGDGKGEFVVMRAPPELPIAGLVLTIRPQQAQVQGGAAPARLFIAGPHDLVEVTLPEDAWRSPGARYQVALDPPLQGGCLALVLDSAFDQSRGANVTLAEVGVMSELGNRELPALVASLAGGGQRAEAAKALLAAGGAPAFAAVAKAFGSLDEGGRRVALEVMDRAPCEQSAGTYVQALTGRVRAQAQHAQSRLRRCGAAAGEALSRALDEADKTDKRVMPLLVGELALTDPARAVRAFVPLLDEKTVLRRRLLRSALGQAARSDRAEQAFRELLADPRTPTVALIDLLRSLGERAPRFEPEASAAVLRLLSESPSFRTRYLLLGPSAVLGPVSPAVAASFRRSLGSDPDPHVRAAAIALIRRPDRFQRELVQALSDREMRVREASAHALASPQAAFATAPLVERLSGDPWPLVRAAAADALALQVAGAPVDEPLARALEDSSALVRARSVRALGQRGAAGTAGRIRDRLRDDEEWPEVRAEAARALGALCDAESTDVLTAFARKLADPMASPEAQLIATGAVASLGRLAPHNLKELLGPLTHPKAPPQARRAAGSALSAREHCPARR